MRPGCDRPAVARLSYDPVTCAVWLDDIAERVGRNQEICALHAERLTVPRGWELADRRAEQAPMFATPVVAGRDDKSHKRRRRRSSGSEASAQTLALFDVLRQELAEAEADPATVTGPSSVPEPEPEPEAIPEPVAETVPEPAAERDPSHEPEQEPARPPEPVDGESDEDRTPDALKATSPLLSRAFAATGHQRSVLTQLSPADGSTDSDS